MLVNLSSVLSALMATTFDPAASFFGFMGCTAALVFACMSFRPVAARRVARFASSDLLARCGRVRF